MQGIFFTVPIFFIVLVLFLYFVPLGLWIQSGVSIGWGEIGITTTDLRPSGKVEIQGKTYQAFSHGDYIDKNEDILVDGIDENQLLVKKV